MISESCVNDAIVADHTGERDALWTASYTIAAHIEAATIAHPTIFKCVLGQYTEAYFCHARVMLRYAMHKPHQRLLRCTRKSSNIPSVFHLMYVTTVGKVTYNTLQHHICRPSQRLCRAMFVAIVLPYHSCQSVVVFCWKCW